MKPAIFLIFAIIFASFAIGIYLYPKMSDKMVSHWNVQSNPDSYMPKFWGLFLMPIISIVLALLFFLIPKLDPLRKNIDKFRKYYEGFILLIIVFLFYLYLLTLFWNLDFRFNISQMISPAIGILFYYAGILIENSKRNWFIGIRTPWTLSNDIVWQKTHKIGGKLFKISGIIALFGILFKQYAVWFILLPVIFTTIYTIIYSYFEYKRQIKKK